MRVREEEGNGAGRELRELPTTELIRELVTDGQQFIRDEVRLAKAELRSEVTRLKPVGASFGAAGIAAHTALLCFAAMLIGLFARAMPVWVAALIVFALFAGGAAGAFLYGQRRLEWGGAKRPVERLKEEGQWAKDLMQRVRSRRHAHA